MHTRTLTVAICIALCTALLATPAAARSFAGRAEDALKQVDSALAGMLEGDDSFGLETQGVAAELLRLQTDMSAEGHAHSKLDEALEVAASISDRDWGWAADAQIDFVAQLGWLHILLGEVITDFQAGLLSDVVLELPVAQQQTVFDTGVRNWLPFSGAQSEVSEAASFTGWDKDAKFVMVSSGGEIMLNIENNNYTAKWLLAVPFASSISFGIDRGNEGHILLSVHAPDASTHFLIDKGGTGQLYIHRR